MQIVTKEYLDAHRTELGAWTMAQMHVLGVKWPLHPGWRDAICGQELTDEQSARFVAAKNLFSKSTIRKRVKQEVATYKAAGLEPPLVLLQQLAPVVTAPTNPASIRRAAKKAAKKARKQAVRALGMAFSAHLPKLKKAPKLKPKRVKARFSKSPPAVHTSRIDPNSPDFLFSYEWRTVRMVALKKYGARCQCCGASPADGVVMNVDHIKPRRLFPALALDVENLQILCDACNHGKGNWDQTDWRQPHEEPVDPEVAAFIRSIARDTTR